MKSKVSVSCCVPLDPVWTGAERLCGSDGIKQKVTDRLTDNVLLFLQFTLNETCSLLRHIYAFAGRRQCDPSSTSTSRTALSLKL